MNPVYRKWLVIPGIILVGVGLSYGLSQLKPEAPQKESDRLDPLVEVMRLETSSESFRIRSQGTVKPRTETVLSAEVSGAIVSISPKFIAGGVFAPDEVLMRIDPTDYSVAVDKAEALVKQRQIEYDGAKKLRSQGYRAESEYASAAATLSAAQAELVRSRRNLERTYIRLPYEGMVLSKESDIGQFVTPGTRLGVVFATDLAEVRLPLTDVDLAFIDLPSPADATPASVVDGSEVVLTATQQGRKVSWQAHLVRSEGIVDERSRVTYAVAQVADPYQLHGDGVPLPVGTFVAAEIQGTAAMDVIRIPRSALRGSDQVLIVDAETTIEIRTVVVIRADERYAYLGGGVAEGERISITAIEAPTNGMSVRTAEATARTADGGNDGIVASSIKD
jgi:RND family efflux transporter MFP subunit